MKVFLENYNGILDIVQDRLEESGELTTNPHSADIFLIWQDIRGDFLQLSEIVKYHLKKPLVVMQHGRGAVRDYGPPNKFKLLADKILVWGESERNRLLSYGIPNDRIDVVGCPMLPRFEKKQRSNAGKNILFAPVISSKEEPENLLVFAELKKWESEKLKKNIYAHFNEMKKAWAWQEDEMREILLPDGNKELRLWKRHVRPVVPRWATYSEGLVNVKLSNIHDSHQYLAPMINTPQNHPNLIDDLVQLLQNVDVLVCLEEGTMQLMAAYMDIPVIVVDIFKYENYGGCKNYDTIEKIETKSSYWTKNLDKLGSILDHALSNPKELSKHRKQVCVDEGGIELKGDVNARIIERLKSLVQRNETIRDREIVSV